METLLNAWRDAQTLNANDPYSNKILGARKFLVHPNLAIGGKCPVDGVMGQQ